MRRFCYILFGLFLWSLPAIASEKRIEHRMVVDIPFYFAGDSENDINHDLDSVALLKSMHELKLLASDSTSIIKEVEFYSSVSPEGSIQFNKKLGKSRLATTERIIRRYLNLADSIPVKRTERYIPWHDYLLPAIQADSTIPYRNELLKLIYRPTNAKGKDNRRVQLKRAYNGKLWEVVQERYFDHIRKGGVIITYERVISDELTQSLTNQPLTLRGGVQSIEVENLSLPQHSEPAQPISDNKSGLAISVKTNALGWGLAITNAAAELDFAKHWSLHIPIYYAAHNYFTHTIKFRTLATQPEVRYYLKENNTGFFAGAHFGVASYNIAVNGDKRYQDHNGKCPALGGGISIGYRMPLSKRRENWQIEFVVGAGAYSLHYDTFYNVENGRLIGTHRKTYWGLDNAAVNISYKFDLNKRKR